MMEYGEKVNLIHESESDVCSAGKSSGCSYSLEVNDVLVLSGHSGGPFPGLFVQTVFLCCSRLRLQLSTLHTHTHAHTNTNIHPFKVGKIVKVTT